MQRVFRVVDTAELTPVGVESTDKFNRSVRRYGIVSPILVAEVPDEDGVIGLSIIDGNRRVRAAGSAGLPRVPAVVLKATSAKDRARLTLICNYMQSANFHTESSAILTLADDDDAAAQAARVIGLGPAKMQQLYRKIATMPDAVRRAMHEHRIPVTAATWVGSWPDELQREVVELLERRRYVHGTTLRELRASYERRHPEAFQPERDGVSSVTWDNEDPIAIEGPMHASASVSVAIPAARSASATDSPMPTTTTMVRVSPPVASVPTTVIPPQPVVEIVTPRDVPAAKLGEPAPTAPVAQPPMGHIGSHVSSVALRTRPPTSEARDGLTLPSAVSVEGVQSVDSMPGEPFIVQLDMALMNLARDTRAQGYQRAVWVDRAMRAWDRAGVS